MTSDTNYHVATRTGYKMPAARATASCWLRAERETHHLEGQGLIPGAAPSQECHKITGRENIMNGYFLLMQFEKLDMSSFKVKGWPQNQD